MSQERNGPGPAVEPTWTGWLPWRWIRQPFAVLIYHEISSGSDRWCVPEGRFAEHLGFLAEQGCHFASTNDLWQALAGEQELPPRAVCIHFDDARPGVLRGALPVLRRHRAPGTVFVVSGWAERSVEVPERERYSGFLDWEGIRELSQDPLIEIGSHGVSHRNLKRVSRAELRYEVGASRRIIADKAGAKVYHFAAPYNRITPRVRRAVARSGYRTLSGGGGRVNRLLCSPYRLKRFLVTNGTTIETLLRVVGKL